VRLSVLSYTDGLCALCTKWGGGICTDHGTDRGPLREREIEEDRERERKRERETGRSSISLVRDHVESTSG
jgi:hypothetical protein